MDNHTEVPSQETGASPTPPLLYASVWFSVFTVTIWGMMLVFGRKPY